jgi:hypothetical protein
LATYCYRCFCIVEITDSSRKLSVWLWRGSRAPAEKAQYGAPVCTGCLALMAARLIERREFEHVQLLQLGKVLLLLVEREELLIKLPVVDELTKEIMLIQDLSRAS